MKHTARIISALLALITLLVPLVACSRSDDDGNTTTPADSSAAEPAETTSVFVDDDLPDTLKINDTVRFLY